MATTTAVIIGMVQGFALLRRIKSVVQNWRNGKRIDKIEIDAIRKDMGK
jgi:hypothetical protein